MEQPLHLPKTLEDKRRKKNIENSFFLLLESYNVITGTTKTSFVFTFCTQLDSLLCATISKRRKSKWDVDFTFKFCFRNFYFNVEPISVVGYTHLTEKKL